MWGSAAAICWRMAAKRTESVMTASLLALRLASSCDAQLIFVHVPQR